VCLFKVLVMEVVLDNQEFAKLGSQDCREPDYHSTKSRHISRSLWAVRISLRELATQTLKRMYLNHFAEPEQSIRSNARQPS